ncbi:MAG: hypothetical protein IID03_11915 [Candidatus Dadabacteria bacterium]|nr:hypothetical protein [Candidatus Dadabacteria bacterium]
MKWPIRILLKEIKRQVRDLRALLDVSKAMSSETHLDNLLQVIMEKATEVIDADRSSLFLYDASSSSGVKLHRSLEG